jgi:hypothetical protein
MMAMQAWMITGKGSPPVWMPNFKVTSCPQTARRRFHDQKHAERSKTKGSHAQSAPRFIWMEPGLENSAERNHQTVITALIDCFRNHHRQTYSTLHHPVNESKYEFSKRKAWFLLPRYRLPLPTESLTADLFWNLNFEWKLNRRLPLPTSHSGPKGRLVKRSPNRDSSIVKRNHPYDEQKKRGRLDNAWWRRTTGREGSGGAKKTKSGERRNRRRKKLISMSKYEPI